LTVVLKLAYNFAALCLFAPCTMLQFNDKLNGANSTKPLLPAGAVYLAGF